MEELFLVHGGDLALVHVSSCIRLGFFFFFTLLYSVNFSKIVLSPRGVAIEAEPCKIVCVPCCVYSVHASITSGIEIKFQHSIRVGGVRSFGQTHTCFGALAQRPSME